MMMQICSFNGNSIRSISLFQRLQLLHCSTSFSIKDEGNHNCSIKYEGNHDCSIAEFLVNSMGYSQKQSLSLSAAIVKSWRTDDSSSNFSSCNAHSVIQFFHELGFQQSDIEKLVSHFPRFLCSKVEKSLKPKIELLRELGFTESDLVDVILKNPKLLFHNIGPAIHAFRVVVGNDDDVVAILKRSFFINFKGVTDYLIANVELLQTCYGIPPSDIRKFILQHPEVFIKKTDLFRNILIKVEEMLGIPRDSSMFFYGVHLLSSINEKSLEDKFAVFRSFGWTQSDIMALIRRNPLCLLSSEARIKKKLGFLMNQLDYKPDYLARRPRILIPSLEKTLLPRYRVLQVLKEKGLCKKDQSLSAVFNLPECKFLRRFVLPYEEVHQVYAELKGCEVGSMLQK